jgi:serine/threonine protein kinase/WD40 repeat protein
MAVAEEHPDVAVLEAFSLGRLDDASLVAVEAHLAGCSICQERGSAVSGDKFVELLRRVHARTPDETKSVPLVQAPLSVTGAEAETLPPPAQPDKAGAGTVEFLPDELVNHERYRVIRLIGEGGMGAVYEAEHRVMQRTVALKVIHRAYTERPAAVERFRREVRAAARLSHPNIVTTYDAEDAGDTHFLVMEYVEGTSLGRLAKERGPLPVADACNYVRQAALGLQHAHERGMVHRDVKPDNLMRIASPASSAPGVVKLLDFGLATLTAERGEGLTSANVDMGTADYMAPEQAEDARSADIRADVYSLGCTLYYLLTGSVPFPAPTSLLKILAHRERPLPDIRKVRPEVSPELAAVVQRLLAKKPQDRYQTPGEVAAALEPFTKPELSKSSATIVDSSATIAEPSIGKSRHRPRRRLLVAAAALLLACLTIAGVAIYRIQTDKGELVITTESDDVKVVIKQGGEEVSIIDAKTDKEIRLTLRSGTYELELQGAPEGLKLDVDNVTLMRGETKLARIEHAVTANSAGEKVGEVRVFAGHADGIYPVAFSPNGQLILTGATNQGEDLRDCHVQIWDAATGREIRRLNGQRSSISCAAFSADGKSVVAGSFWQDPTLRVWDVQSGTELQHFSHSDPHNARSVWGVAIAPNSRHVFSCCDDSTVRMWNVETGKEAKQFKGQGSHPRCLALSRDGQYLVIAGVHQDCSIRVWEVESGKQVGVFDIDDAQEKASVAFSPDGHSILSGCYDGSVQLWDVRTGKEVRRFEGHSKAVFGVAFSPDGSRVLSGSEDRTVRLWEVRTGKELYRFIGHTRGVRGVCFSPDGRFAVSGGNDNTARLWRLPDPSFAKEKEKP